ncbi:MAG: hypothetical protein V9G12_16615 [Microthrixaceae bacterium]
MDNATLAPTYRAGYMFHSALKTMRKLEQDHGVDSVAFEMLGPPRLSKLLYESYLLKVCFGDVRTVARTGTSILSRRLLDLIEADDQLRSQIISIGIPILLPDGRSLVRASTIKIPPAQGQDEFPINASSIDRWAHDGWVDLREKNMKHWRQRFTQIIKEVEGSRMMKRVPAPCITGSTGRISPRSIPGRSVAGSSRMRKRVNG